MSLSKEFKGRKVRELARNIASISVICREFCLQKDLQILRYGYKTGKASG